MSHDLDISPEHEINCVNAKTISIDLLQLMKVMNKALKPKQEVFIGTIFGRVTVVDVCEIDQSNVK